MFFSLPVKYLYQTFIWKLRRNYPVYFNLFNCPETHTKQRNTIIFLKNVRRGTEALTFHYLQWESSYFVPFPWSCCHNIWIYNSLQNKWPLNGNLDMTFFSQPLVFILLISMFNLSIRIRLFPAGINCFWQFCGFVVWCIFVIGVVIMILLLIWHPFNISNIIWLFIIVYRINMITRLLFMDFYFLFSVSLLEFSSSCKPECSWAYLSFFDFLLNLWRSIDCLSLSSFSS